MLVLLAPDKFAGTLSATEAADAIAAGWRTWAPADAVDRCPMSDGGPGFVDVMSAAVGGSLLAVTVTGPLGAPAPATLLLCDGTAYVESAQACGLHLVGDEVRDPHHASTRGVGELVAAAVDAGAARVVVGLGGSATNDAGAGLLAALGAESDADLCSGPSGLRHVGAVDLSAARRRLSGVELVAATDVDNPLLGMFGATKAYGPQKGLPSEQVMAVDAVLERFVVATFGAGVAERKRADAPGAGAGGGLGFALLALGAERIRGVDLVADAVGIPVRAAACDLVVTGEGSFDFSSRSGKVVSGIAVLATSVLRPCVVVAGRVLVGAREMRTMGIESAYSVSDLVGAERAVSDPWQSLAMTAERVARTWSR